MSDREKELATPSLRALSFILRNKELWPRDFVWDFLDCATCAMGLAWRLWAISSPNSTAMAHAFGISQQISTDIFVGRSLFEARGQGWLYRPGLLAVDVQPEHVAAAIDQYLAKMDLLD